jgi:hypothetical protein
MNTAMGALASPPPQYVTQSAQATMPEGDAAQYLDKYFTQGPQNGVRVDVNSLPPAAIEAYLQSQEPPAPAPVMPQASPAPVIPPPQPGARTFPISQLDAYWKAPKASTAPTIRGPVASTTKPADVGQRDVALKVSRDTQQPVTYQDRVAAAMKAVQDAGLPMTPEVAKSISVQAAALHPEMDSKITPEVQLKLNALTIGPETGYTGMARSMEEAQGFRTAVTSRDTVVKGVEELISIANEIGDNPLKKSALVNPELVTRAELIQKSIIAALRVPILGPGVMTENERKILETMVANPTNLLSWSVANKGRLNALKSKMIDQVKEMAKAQGLSPASGSVDNESSGSNYIYDTKGNLKK